MVERAKPVTRAIELTPPRPSARASRATNRRRLCSFKTGAICRYRLRAIRVCAARIIYRRYVARFLTVNSSHAFVLGPISLSPDRYLLPRRQSKPQTRFRLSWQGRRSNGSGSRRQSPRPGGNVTGTAAFGAERGGKVVDLIREVIPSVQRVAVLADSASAHSPSSRTSSSLASRVRDCLPMHCALPVKKVW